MLCKKISIIELEELFVLILLLFVVKGVFLDQILSLLIASNVIKILKIFLYLFFIPQKVIVFFLNEMLLLL